MRGKGMGWDQFTATISWPLGVPASIS